MKYFSLQIELVIGFFNPPYQSDENSIISMEICILNGTISNTTVSVQLDLFDQTAMSRFFRYNAKTLNVDAFFCPGFYYAGVLDYQDLGNQTLMFSSNKNCCNIVIEIFDDSIFEPTESFQASLSFSGIAPSHVTLEPAQAIIKILGKATNAQKNDSSTNFPTTSSLLKYFIFSLQYLQDF